MRGLGTIINIILIVLAGTFGCSFSSKMKERMQETLFLITGISVIFIGIAGAMEQMLIIENGRLIPRNIMMVICCLAIHFLAFFPTVNQHYYSLPKQRFRIIVT